MGKRILIRIVLYISFAFVFWHYFIPKESEDEIMEWDVKLAEIPNDTKKPAEIAPTPEESTAIDAPIKPKASPFDEAPEGSIKDQWLLSFDNDEDLARYLHALQKAGIKNIKVIPQLRGVRIRISNDNERRILDKLAPPNADAGFNQIVQSPPPPKAPPKTYTADAMFDHNALEWLGTPDDIEDWGKGITIAVLDSGVVEHPSLKDKITTSLDLTQSDEAVKVEDLIHGTAVASLISGDSSFAKGIAPAAEIMSLRVLNAEGQGDHFALAHGIVYAVDNGAKVINLSLGGYNSSSVLESAIKYAANNDVSLVAAVGNDGAEQIAYPAAYRDVMAVGAIDALGEVTHFSNSGSEIDITAPGLGVLSAAGSHELSHFSGTSTAAPFVSATIAHLRSKDPSLSAPDAADILLSHANDTEATGFDSDTGAGILNIERIVTRNESGLYDGAISNIVLDSENEGNVIVSVQNRGNEEFEQGAELIIKAGNFSQSFPIDKLSPNQTAAINWQDPTLLEALQKGANIEAVIRINGAEDDRNHNDTASVFLKLVDDIEDKP